MKSFRHKLEKHFSFDRLQKCLLASFRQSAVFDNWLLEGWQICKGSFRNYVTWSGREAGIPN